MLKHRPGTIPETRYPRWSMQDDRGSNLAGGEGAETAGGAPEEAGAERARRELELDAKSLRARPPLPAEDAAAQVERIREAAAGDAE